MGQRLVINIKAEGKILANAYFHWDGYTECAMEHAKQLISLHRYLDKPDEFKNMPLKKKAIYMLEFLGAEITPEDFELNEYPDIWIRAKNRNDGLIQVSEAQIKYAEDWAEGLIEFDIVRKKINFDVFFYYDEGDLEEEDDDGKSVVEMPLPWDMSYDEFLGFLEWTQNHQHKTCQLYWNGEQYCRYIE